MIYNEKKVLFIFKFILMCSQPNRPNLDFVNFPIIFFAGEPCLWIPIRNTLWQLIDIPKHTITIFETFISNKQIWDICFSKCWRIFRIVLFYRFVFFLDAYRAPYWSFWGIDCNIWIFKILECIFVDFHGCWEVHCFCVRIY